MQHQFGAQKVGVVAAVLGVKVAGRQILGDQMSRDMIAELGLEPGREQMAAETAIARDVEPLLWGQRALLVCEQGSW